MSICRFANVPHFSAILLLLLGLMLAPRSAAGDSVDIVLYASEAPTVAGNWSSRTSSGAAGGRSMASVDHGWSSTNAPLASPSHYFEMTFSAAANTPYRLWLRLRASNDSKWNDAVWVQFSDALTDGGPMYRIGTTSGVLVNLEECSGCGHSQWGWQDTAFWLNQRTTITFATTGTHTIRVQTREDGVEIDQIVLSPATYLSSAPGLPKNDATILARSSGDSGGSSALAYSGTPAVIPGTIEAVRFDTGGANVSFADSTSGNAGGAFRATDVDIEPSSEGGYNVGWSASGEWLGYTVSVGTGGAYNAQFRVASIGGGSMQVDFGAPSNTTSTFTVPDTGGWQTWTTVTVPVTLAAGQQLMVVRFRSANVNFHSVKMTSSSAGSTLAYGGTPAAIPGIIDAVRFDAGGRDVSYADTTSGNSGGAFRDTDVDIEPSSAGGFNVGWTDAGEWLNYSVNVANAGAFTAQVRVASMGGGSMQVSFGTPSNATGTIAVPDTGGWQNWTIVNLPVTLAAGAQLMTVRFTTSRINFHSMSLASLPSGSSTSGETISVGVGGDFQAALNAADPGDTILLQAGATFTGNFILPAKSASSSAYITIRSSAPDSALPGGGTRMTPAYASQLPKLRSPNNGPAIATAAGAHHYRLQFLEFLPNADPAGNIMALGDAPGKQNSLHEVPHDLIVDRVYMHGHPTYGQKRGIALNSASTVIVYSHISDIKASTNDSQAIAGWNGPGPYVISDNYLEAAGENILFGGGDPSIPNLVPSDIMITRNHIAKPLSWRGSKWIVKNLLELKNAQRVVIDGNLFENNWAAAQTGYAVLLKSVNQDGNAPWSVVQQVEFTNNIVRNVAGGISLSRTATDSIEINHITIRNNFFDNVSRATYGGTGFLMVVIGGSDITVDHNTVFNDGTSVVMPDMYPSVRFNFTNNLVLDNAWAIKGTGTAAGSDTIAKYFPGGEFRGGIYVGSDPDDYPSGNYYPATLADVGFVDASSGDYRLSSNSIYGGGATDGADPGCDFAALVAAMSR